MIKWDYTDLADHYDRRADYSEEAVDEILKTAGISAGSRIADIGAGTGKLTRLLLDRDLVVLAVEPNAAMRARGIENTNGRAVTWVVGTAEQTGLPASSVRLVTFGSSFNVADRECALAEAARILEPSGWFACLWNHRELDDPLQARVEAAIRQVVPNYQYGARREDQQPVIESSGLYGTIRKIEKRFVAVTSAEDYVDAWRSHATLHRQAGDHFAPLMDEITSIVGEQSTLRVPFVTVGWCAQRR